MPSLQDVEIASGHATLSQTYPRPRVGASSFALFHQEDIGMQTKTVAELDLSCCASATW